MYLMPLQRGLELKLLHVPDLDRVVRAASNEPFPIWTEVNIVEDEVFLVHVQSVDQIEFNRVPDLNFIIASSTG